MWRRFGAGKKGKVGYYWDIGVHGVRLGGLWAEVKSGVGVQV